MSNKSICRPAKYRDARGIVCPGIIVCPVDGNGYYQGGFRCIGCTRSGLIEETKNEKEE